MLQSAQLPFSKNGDIITNEGTTDDKLAEDMSFALKSRAFGLEESSVWP